jgi:hypothetical protein
VQCTTETKSRAAQGKVSQSQNHLSDPHFWTSKYLDFKGVPIPSAQKVMARWGIEPSSPAYMADALTLELMTMPITITVKTLTDGPHLNCRVKVFEGLSR